MGSTHPTQATYRKLRSKAELLRHKGLSYKEIRKHIPVAKSTLSLWCRDITLSKTQTAKLGKRYDAQMRGAKANHLKSVLQKQNVRTQGLKDIKPLSNKSLKIAGAVLYWAEGNKSGGTAFSNSDPVCIVFFVRWLEKFVNISPTSLSADLHLHQGQNDNKEKRFWSQITGIPTKNFHKTFYKPTGTGHRKNLLYHGTLRVRVKGNHPELLRYQILAWAEATAKQLVPQKIMKIKYGSRVGR